MCHAHCCKQSEKKSVPITQLPAQCATKTSTNKSIGNWHIQREDHATHFIMLMQIWAHACAYAATANPIRSLPKSNTVWYEPKKMSPRIHNGPEGMSSPMKPLTHISWPSELICALMIDMSAICYSSKFRCTIKTFKLWCSARPRRCDAIIEYVRDHSCHLPLCTRMRGRRGDRYLAE